MVCGAVVRTVDLPRGGGAHAANSAQEGRAGYWNWRTKRDV